MYLFNCQRRTNTFFLLGIEKKYEGAVLKDAMICNLVTAGTGTAAPASPKKTMPRVMFTNFADDTFVILQHPRPIDHL